MTVEHTPLTPASFLRRHAVALLMTAGVFILTYMDVYCSRMHVTDYLLHSMWALALTPEQMTAFFYDGSERLWHVLVKLVFSAVPNMWFAASFVTAAANAAAYFILFRVFDSSLPQRSKRWPAALLLAAVFVVSMLHVPGGTFYRGGGTVNVWHNPTSIIVRPFAAAAFYMTVRIYNRRRYGSESVWPAADRSGGGFSFDGGFWAEFRRPVYRWYELILYPLLLLFSAYAKPCFLQYFAPAILLFLLYDVIRTKGMLLPFCIKLAIPFIPAGLYILAQLLNFFDLGVISAAEAAEQLATMEKADIPPGVAIYFISDSFSGPGDALRSFGIYFMRLMRLTAFPVLMSVLSAIRLREDTGGRLALTGFLVAWFESLMLHETGRRAGDGNFGWAYYLAGWLLWTTAVGQYLALVRERSAAGRLTRWLGTALLLWHFASGVGYLYYIFLDGNYLI